MALMDGEFGHLRGKLASMGVTLNESSRDEHMGDIERYIRTVKERMQAIYNTLPFNKILSWLVVEMAKASMFWLNGMPPKDSFGNQLSPRTIITGQKLDYKRHCRFQFGEYAQTHEQHDNSMNPRTVGALALHPTGNAQGSFYFMSISTGWVLNWLHATPIPMPNDMVDRIHRLARQQRTNPGLLFGDRNMNSTDMESVDSSESEDNEDYFPDQEELDEESMVEDEDSGQVYDDVNEHDELMGNISINMSESNSVGPPRSPTREGMGDENQGVEDHEIEDEEQDGHNLTDLDMDENPEVVDRESEGVGEEGYDAHIDGTKDENQDDMSMESDAVENVTADQDSGEENGMQGTPRYNLQKNRTRSYKDAYDPELYETGHEKQSDRGDVVLTTVDDAPEDTPQMSMKKGLKLFGKGGYAAVKKEMQQLHNRKVM